MKHRQFFLIALLIVFSCKELNENILQDSNEFIEEAQV
jgi:hypothetical protein